MKKFNKKLRVFIIIALCLTIMAGCSSSNKSSNDALKDPQTNNETSKTPDQSKSDENKTINNNETENNENSLLKNIKTLAEEGKIINSNFADNSSNISDIEEKLGKADKSEWVGGAKGNYSTYSKYNVVFGSNKGGRIFEIRSFDSRLNDITLSKVEKYFGTPDHNVTSNGEIILGYVAGANYKILFVFKAPTNNNTDPELDHYSVLYPKGTVNSMAGDPGREW
ncbi:MAG TPA: YjgB family protein [Clostridium sp.]